MQQLGSEVRFDKKELRKKMQEYGKANRRRNITVNPGEEDIHHFDMMSHGGRNRKFDNDADDSKSFLSLDENKLAKVGIRNIQPSNAQNKKNAFEAASSKKLTQRDRTL